MPDATDLSCFAVMPSGPGADTRRRVNASLTPMTEQLKSKPSGLPRGHEEEILVELKFFTNSLLNVLVILKSPLSRLP